MILTAFLDAFWKHRDRSTHPGTVIGSYGHQYSPEIIFDAFGLDSVNILVGGNEKWQTRGMEYLAPTSCVYSRQVIGFFEEMENNNVKDPIISPLVLTNFCNGDYHSIEMLKHYFGAKLLPLPVPYKSTPHALDLFTDTLREFVSRVADISGRPYDPEALRSAMERADEIQRLASQFAALPVRGGERIDTWLEVAMAPVGMRASLLERAIEKGRAASGNRGGSTANVVITGSPLMVGDRFIRILESLEVPVRFIDFHYADQVALKQIPKTPGELPALGRHVDFTDPLSVLAAYFLEMMAPERMVSGRKDHLEARIEQALRYQRFLEGGEKIDGVISHVLKFCDVYGTDRSEFKARFQEKKAIPVLDIERDFSASSVGQLSTRIEAFLELIHGA